MISKVQTKTGAIMRYRGMIFKTLAQTVLLYGSEFWVVTGVMLKVLESFYHWAAWQIAGMTDRCTEDRKWEYPGG